MSTTPTRPVNASQMARIVGVPVAWLRAEADAGRIPHVKAGRVILFNAEVVAELLLRRAKVEGAKCEEVA